MYDHTGSWRPQHTANERRYRHGRGGCCARSACWVGGVLWLVVFGLLAGCAGHERVLPTPTALATPVLPGVIALPGVFALERQQPIPVITALATATSTATSHTAAAQQVLFALGEPLSVYHTLYVSALDGSVPHPIPLELATPCLGLSPLSVTPDGRWAACITAQHGAEDTDRGVQLINLTARQASPATRQLLSTTGGEYLRSLAWSPDGRALAVLIGTPTTCDIKLYTVDAAAAHADLRAVLRVDAFLKSGANSEGCPFPWMSWSPDGEWLAFVYSGVHPALVYTVPLARVLSPMAYASSAPSSPIGPLPIAQNLFQPVGTTSSWLPPAWLPGRNVLTVTNEELNAITEYDLATQQQTTVFRLAHGSLERFAWTTDALHVVFAFCPSYTCRSQGIPELLYVYTPLS